MGLIFKTEHDLKEIVSVEDAYFEEDYAVAHIGLKSLEETVEVKVYTKEGPFTLKDYLEMRGATVKYGYVIFDEGGVDIPLEDIELDVNELEDFLLKHIKRYYK